ncbi:hypothetical protein Ddye_016872 [Dipteronia dyeriana]|uniref:Cation efflux protein cytoplasmic domain-containing protein n=1 Tax=Dipteronia dyeriana TaxID=168575 RepID=A0AAD9X0G4_9ROSI|nr:hypothetical protein Ddye_016872 [Dipteronia dyeriana]
MRFRFNNFFSIYRSLSSQSNRTHHPIIIPSLNPQFRFQDRDHHKIYFKVPIRWHFAHSHHDHHQHHHDFSGKDAENIFRLGLASDIALATGKAFIGYMSGSTAIIADAAHSISDVVLSGIALWSFKAAKAPKDKEHPYGHGKFETLGALGISCMLLATAGGIGWHALDLLLHVQGLTSTAPEVVNQSLTHDHVHSHHHGIDMEHPTLALTMMVLSISVKEGLYWITKRAGERQGSGLMIANAWHHRADAISSVVALIGVGGSILGVGFLDPLAGLVVSGMILKVGLETGYQSVLELVDAAIPMEQLDPIRQTILKGEGVKGCHRLRGRRAGSSLYLDVHIVVEPFSSVSAAHGIGEYVRHQIHRSHPEVSEVFIHIDPAYLQLSPSMMDLQESLKGSMAHNINFYVEESDIEEIVHNIFSSKFPQKMVVERITPHLFQGKILLEIEVSMPPDTLIRDAMKVAETAEKEILKAASNVFQVSLQLRLGRPLPSFHTD